MTLVHILPPASPRPVRVRVRVHGPPALRPFIDFPRCSARPIIVPTTYKTNPLASIVPRACSVLALHSTTLVLGIPLSHALHPSLAHGLTTLAMPIHTSSSVLTTLSSTSTLRLRTPSHAPLRHLPISVFQPHSLDVCLPFALTDLQEVPLLRDSRLRIRLNLDRPWRLSHPKLGHLLQHHETLLC